MKILYAIQGTGNGHISRAYEIIPALQQHGEVDILLSGCQAEVALPFPIVYRYNGLSFAFGKNGGIDYIETYKRSHIKELFREVQELPVHKYDLVISDFEPVSAWACRLRGKPCVGMSHQAAVIHKHAPHPATIDLIGQAVLRFYAPVALSFGFHFLPYGKNISTPVIRQQVRALNPSNNGHYTVYLPAYSKKRLLKFFSLLPDVRWEVFSKHCNESSEAGNIRFFTINNEDFVRSMSGAAGVLCSAGFETPAEVIYLSKKLLVVPMKGQYEQQCNAAALKMLGVPVMKNLKRKRAKQVSEWIKSGQVVSLDYPDETEDLVSSVLLQWRQFSQKQKGEKQIPTKASGFREYLLRKIFYRSTVDKG
jgi:uncharacterized protein (TIGR00661 family)